MGFPYKQLPNRNRQVVPASGYCTGWSVLYPDNLTDTDSYSYGTTEQGPILGLEDSPAFFPLNGAVAFDLAIAGTANNGTITANVFLAQGIYDWGKQNSDEGNDVFRGWHLMPYASLACTLGTKEVDTETGSLLLADAMTLTLQGYGTSLEGYTGVSSVVHAATNGFAQYWVPDAHNSEGVFVDLNAGTATAMNALIRART